jgi:hypothetical protein
MKVINTAGEILTSASGGGSLTVEEVDGAPTVASVVKIKFAQADGFTVTDEGGGIARINVGASAAPDLLAQTIALLALMEF